MTELKDSRFTISIHALREEGDGTPKCSSTASRRFLSTPSARRATRNYVAPRLTELFLSTPSARRATLVHLEWVVGPEDFYPRPPRGGRQGNTAALSVTTIFLSTPSARRATPLAHRAEPHTAISIHALREEGDRPPEASRPANSLISIHALREEGDITGDSLTVLHDMISIHALREEGDAASRPHRAVRGNFYPRPPRGGRPAGRHGCCAAFTISIHALREEGDLTSGASFSSLSIFLSTPSARRATTISSISRTTTPNFYPRPPRGGRHKPAQKAPDGAHFYPRPPRGGRHSSGTIHC